MMELFVEGHKYLEQCVRACWSIVSTADLWQERRSLRFDAEAEVTVNPMYLRQVSWR